MKVAFFSKDGNCGVTSNMAAISIASVLMYGKKILTLENHWSNDSIAQYLLYENSPGIIKDGEVRYLGHSMIDSLVLHFANRTNKRRADIMTIELIQNSLYYMPQNAFSKDVFDYEFYFNVIPRLSGLEITYPNLFIDTKNHTMNTKVILEEADLVVVLLKQNYEDINSFFQQYSSLSNKSLFLISNYRPNKSCNLNQIMKDFQLNKDNLIAISHNAQFETELFHGRVINYIYDNYGCKPGNPNYKFIRDIKHAAKMIAERRIDISSEMEETLHA